MSGSTTQDVYLNGFPNAPSFETKQQERESLKERLAQAFRIFAHRAYNENAAGNITLRDPVNRGAYWVNPLDAHWGLLQPGDLLLIDQHATILPDSGPSRLFDKDGFLIHAAIYAARPDVTCIAQMQPPYGTVFSHLGTELSMITQDSCAFYKDNAVYDGDTPGVEAARGAAATLGDRKALFLKNNGFLIATASVQSMVFFYISCEKCCQVQMLAERAAAGRRLGIPHGIGDRETDTTRKTVGPERAGFFSAWPEFQALEERERRAGD